MAANTAKPRNSSDSEGEIEWTFIDAAYDGTIETKKDSVTYRKPTYSEILKGILEKELEQEVESEPEFEVLASFKFRPEGESFGVGSSAPRAPKSTITKAVDDGGSPSSDDSCSTDDDIMIISNHFKTSCQPDDADVQHTNSQTVAADDDCTVNDETESAGILAKSCSDVEDAAESDDDFVIPLAVETDDEDVNVKDEDNDELDKNDITASDNEASIYSESTCDLTTSSFSESAGNVRDDETDDEKDGEKDGETGDGEKGGQPAKEDVDECKFIATAFPHNVVYDNSNKDLAWDNLLINLDLMNALPRMSESGTSFGNDSQSKGDESDIEFIADFDDTDNERSMIGQDLDDVTDSSSFDNISESADGDIDFDETDDVLIPCWFFDDNHKMDDVEDSADDFTDYSISDIEDAMDSGNAAIDTVCSGNVDPIIPSWLFDANYSVNKSSNDSTVYSNLSDIEDVSGNTDSFIPSWFYDANHSVNDYADYSNIPDVRETEVASVRLYDGNYNSKELDNLSDDYTDYSDSDSDDSDCDDSSSAIDSCLPEWLFSDKRRQPEDTNDGFSTSHLFVDVPSFVILLCLTTALGLSIGHGLTVYLSSHSLSRNTKESFLTAEELAKVDLLQMEDELYRQKEAELLSNHLRYDLKELHRTLQNKHYRLLNTHQSTEGRLHITKSMSWFWRWKYGEEKRRNQNSNSSDSLSRQLKDLGALYAREKKLANQWRRFKKTYDLLGRKKNSSRSSEMWSRKSSDAGIKYLEAYRIKANLASKYWVQAIITERGIDWKAFKKRWTHDLKTLKRRNSCSNSSSRIKTAATRKKVLWLDPFARLNSSNSCKRAKKSDVFGQCFKNGPSLEGRKRHSLTRQNTDKNLKTAKSGARSKDEKHMPCFVKLNSSKDTSVLVRKDLSGSITARDRSLANTKLKGRKGQRRRHKEIRIKDNKRKKATIRVLDVKTQVNELKNVLAELRRERRKAEREKVELKASWKRLKRQRLQFQIERFQQKKNDKKKLTRVKSKLKKTRARLKTWKKVAAEANTRASRLHRDLKNKRIAKQGIKDIAGVKRELRLEKRKLREQRNGLKSMKELLRKEHRNYAREGWRMEKVRKELDTLKMQHRTQSSRKKSKQGRKKSKQGRKKSKVLGKNRKKQQQKCPTRKPKKERKKNRKENTSSGEKGKKRKKKKQKRYWEKLEKKLKEWAWKMNQTVQGQHARWRGTKSKIWTKLQEQFQKLVNWDWMKKKKKKTQDDVFKTKKNTRDSKNDGALVYEKVLAEQMKFEKEKKNKLNVDNSGKQWKQRSSTVNMNSKDGRSDLDKRKKRTRKKDLESLVRQRRRKQRKKYQREFERLQQWALQMNEKKLEHERIYKEKEPNSQRERREKLDKTSSNSRALVSLENANSSMTTLMLLLQPQGSETAQKKMPKKGSEDKEKIIHGVKKAQLDHDELVKKKSSVSTGLTISETASLTEDKSNTYWERPSVSKDKAVDGPTPPFVGPYLYGENSFLEVIGKIGPKEDTSMNMPHPPPPWNHRANDDKDDPMYMRKAVERDVFSTGNPGVTWIPRPGPLKSDGTWFFHRSANRAEQRLLYEPLNRHIKSDGLGQDFSKSQFHRSRRGEQEKDGSWAFERARDRAEQRSNVEPWYVRRAEGRETDRQGQKDSWFIERGYYRDMMHDHGDDQYSDDQYGYDQYDYDDYFEEAKDTDHDDEWFQWSS